MREELIDEDREQKGGVELEERRVLHRSRQHPLGEGQWPLVGTDQIVASDEEIELAGEDTLGGKLAMWHGHRDKEAVTKDTEPRPLPAGEGDLDGSLR